MKFLSTSIIVLLISTFSLAQSPWGAAMLTDEELNNYSHYVSLSENMLINNQAVCELKLEETDHLLHDAPFRKDFFQLADESCSIFSATYTGFNADAISAFEYAMELWSRTIEGTIPIRIDARLRTLGNAIAAAGPFVIVKDFPGAAPNTWYVESLADQLANTDHSGAMIPDIIIRFNSNVNWYYGTDGNAPEGSVDFVTIALHEIAHGLGFVGSANATRDPLLGNYGYPSPTLPVIYDLFTANGNAVFTTDIDPPGTSTAALGDQFQGGDLFFAGPEATNQNFGVPPQLFAPSIFRQGASYSHWNESTFPPGHGNSMMTPSIIAGEAIHYPGASTLGAFSDMGWTFCEEVMDPIEISGLIWADENFSGTQDNDEPGIEGVRIVLYTCDSTFISESFSGPDGSYSFAPFSAGNYFVQVENIPGFITYPDREENDDLDSDIDPVTNSSPCFIISGGTMITNLDAGVTTRTVIPTLSTWSIIILGFSLLILGILGYRSKYSITIETISDHKNLV